MRCTAAVGIHNNFSARQAGISLRSADHETSGRVDIILRVLIQKLLRDHMVNHKTNQVSPQCLHIHFRRMLRGDHHRIYTHRAPILIILHRNLSLSIRAQIVNNIGLSNFRQAHRQLVGQRDRQRHQLRGLIAGIAEHHALIAGPVLQLGIVTGFVFQRLIHTHSNIG